jgi:hypothetical protein
MGVHRGKKNQCFYVISFAADAYKEDKILKFAPRA